MTPVIWHDPRLMRPSRVGKPSNRWTFLLLGDKSGFAVPLARMIREVSGAEEDTVAWTRDNSVVGRLVVLSGRHIIAYCVSDHANGRNTLKYLYVEPAFRLLGIGSTLVANAALEVPDWPTYVTLEDKYRTADPFFLSCGFHHVSSDPDVYAREAAVRPGRR